MSADAGPGLRVVRDVRAEDVPALRAMHRAQGVDYAFPDLESPLFFIRKVIEVDGVLVGALLLKLCAETMLLLGGVGPAEKMTAMCDLQAVVLEAAHARGLDEIHAAIPEIGFDRRLRELGWAKDRPGWNLWTRATEGRGER